MSNQQIDVTQGTNYTIGRVGPLNELDQYTLEFPKLGTIHGKLFLKESLGLTSAEISLNKLPAGATVPFLHKHKTNEEIYIFTRGRGQMLLDGKVIEVQEGTIVKLRPDVARTWRNNSDTDLYYIVIQAEENSLKAYTGSDGEILPEPVKFPD